MIIRFLSVSMVLVCLVGCNTANSGKPKPIVYVQDINLGIVLEPVKEVGTSKLMVGFERDVFTVVPRKSNSADADAMSLVSFCHVGARGIDKIRFCHLIASGDASKSVITNGEQIRKINEKIFDNVNDVNGDKK